MIGTMTAATAATDEPAAIAAPHVGRGEGEAGGRDLAADAQRQHQDPPVRGAVAGAEEPKARPRRSARSLRGAVREGSAVGGQWADRFPPPRTFAVPVETVDRDGNVVASRDSEELAEACLGMARSVAHRYVRPGGVAYEDLESVAFVGLLHGCRLYDPSIVNPANGKPYRVSTIAYRFITGALLHFFRDQVHPLRLPSRWRERWGKVKRLLADPDADYAEIERQCGLAAGELDEMLAGMADPSVLNEEVVGANGTGPEAVDDELFGPLLQAVREGFGALPPHDQGLIQRWWGKPTKLAVPQQPLHQFNLRVRAVLRGVRPQEIRQKHLPITLPPPAAVVGRPKGPRRNLAEIREGVVQLGLFTPRQLRAIGIMVPIRRRKEAA